jgi:hypothetical protein
MFPSDRFFKFIIFASGLSLICTVPPAYSAMDASFELDAQTLGASTTTDKNSKYSRPVDKRRMERSSKVAVNEGVVHTIKSGDNLFRILMRDYGFSNTEAEYLIGQICRENNISDIRHLKIGQKIILPSRSQKGGVTGKHIKAPLLAAADSLAGGQLFRLESPETALSEMEASTRIRQVWSKLLPPRTDSLKPIVLQSPSFSLTLDPQRYPVYAAMDNGRILVDQGSSIPPLVKALISEKDPSVRIVSESPLNGKRFLSAMLDSAKFYSVEEGFSADFGIDPKLTIHSDFKIEKTQDSLIKQDLVLMNAGRVPFPWTVSTFLKKEGFTVYEPFALPKSARPVPSGKLYQVTSRRQSDIVDALLSSISIVPDKNRLLDVFFAENNGISLSVNAERYFERGGQRYVVTSYDADPIAYTLYRILETKGYHVAILEDKDDFRTVTEKLLSRMRIPGVYSQHKLNMDTGSNYSLQMSGFKLENPDFPNTGVFLTNLELDRVIRDLLAEDGYSIFTK